MRILGEAHVFQIEGKAERVEVQRADADGVALQAGIQLPLEGAAQGFIDEEAGDDGRDGHECDGPGAPDPPASHSVPSSPRPLAYATQRGRHPSAARAVGLTT
jgi:hypothetical protein